MGFLGWLRGRRENESGTAESAPAPTSAPVPAAAPAATRRFAREREALFDLDRTAALAALFRVPSDQRDGSWHQLFFDAAWHGSVAMPSAQPFQGPDFFPYLRFDVPRGGAFESQSLGNVAEALVQRGVGAAIFASPDDPLDAAQFVFSMGRLDAMLRFDNAEGDPIDIAEKAEPMAEDVYTVTRDGAHERLVTKKAHEVMLGAPSRSYLPPAVARALYTHLRDGWQIAEPRVAVLFDPAARPQRALVVNKRHDGFAEGVAVDQAARMLLWYLTPQQTLMLMPDSMSEDELVPLADYCETA